MENLRTELSCSANVILDIGMILPKLSDVINLLMSLYQIDSLCDSIVGKGDKFMGRASYAVDLWIR